MGGGPSKQPDYWEPDNASDTCRLCEQKWTPLRRRHHCRFPTCGSLVCDDCSKHRAEIPGYNYKGPQRVCDRCKMRDAAIAAAAASAGYGAAGGGASVRSASGMQRALSMDPSSAYAGAASDGAFRAATPRAASSLAVIEADRNRRATTPRLGGAGGAASPIGGAGRAVSSSAFIDAQRGVSKNSSSSGVAAAAASGRPPTAPGNNSSSVSSPASAGAAAGGGGVPTPRRYVKAVLQLVFASPRFRRAAQAYSSSSSMKRRTFPAFGVKDRSNIGRTVLSFLRQPTVWVERASVAAHKSAMHQSSSAGLDDWTRVLLGQRIPPGMSTANTAAASALFLSAPALPSTRPATVWLFLTCRTLTGGASAAGTALSLLRNLQVGIVHESISAVRSRPGSAASSHYTTVASLMSQRVPSIGVCLDGSSFVGGKNEALEFFRLQDGHSAVVISITFDQTSGSVAFTLLNASSGVATQGQQQINSGTPRAAPSYAPVASSSSISAAAAKPSPRGAVSSALTYPVVAAHACPLPSGVAGKWCAAFSVDTSKLDDSTALVAEWL